MLMDILTQKLKNQFLSQKNLHHIIIYVAVVKKKYILQGYQSSYMQNTRRVYIAKNVQPSITLKKKNINKNKERIQKRHGRMVYMII